MTIENVPFDAPCDRILMEMREELGLSQHELARELGFKPQGVRSVRAWEGGECDPSPLAWRCLRLMVVCYRAVKADEIGGGDHGMAYLVRNLPEALK